MKENIVKPAEQDPFGLRKRDFSIRVPEKSEMFSPEEALTYIEGCDFPETADDLMLALEIKQLLGNLGDRHILDAMCGPGRLGRELLAVGAKSIVFHDGDEIMISHAAQKAGEVAHPQQEIHSVQSLVDQIPLPDDLFDLIVCHNSTHQLSSIQKLGIVMKEFLRVTKPGGFILIADFQRGTSPEFMDALEERLRFTKPEIVPLLVPTFLAAFSKEEFDHTLESIPGIKAWSVTDAKLPNLTEEMQTRVNLDPVKGHVLDFSPISLRVIVQKEKI